MNTSTLIINIGKIINTNNPDQPLRGNDLRTLNSLSNAWLLITNNIITDFGSMDAPIPSIIAENTWDAAGRWLFPTWCDSHTHIVFAASREDEFVMKLEGKTYAEIAASGGGILNSARKLRDMDEDTLFQKAQTRLEGLMRLGTGAIEIKSGYGLTLETELKMLRVIKRLKHWAPIPVKATFLGAHAVPEEYKNDKQGYIQLITQTMLPMIAEEELADYIDVFCEKGFFTNEETDLILQEGKKYGLKARIHANQLSSSGAVEVGIKNGAVSVDHLEIMDEAAIAALAHSDTIGTMLPTPAWFLRMELQPARKMIAAGCAVSLASDFNPGSSPSGNMNLVVAMACVQMKMLPEEAINAATTNAAFTMELNNELGTIAKGKLASFFFTEKLPSVNYFPYSFGTNLIEAVMLNGKWYWEGTSNKL